MHQIEDQRLEECRKFLSLPDRPREPEELMEIVRDLLWAVEELQFRRLNDKLTTTRTYQTDPPRPFLVFGSDEAILKYVEEKQIPDDLWRQASAEDLGKLIPDTVHAIKLEGADEKLWRDWENLCRTYAAKTEGSA